MSNESKTIKAELIGDYKVNLEGLGEAVLNNCTYQRIGLFENVKVKLPWRGDLKLRREHPEVTVEQNVIVIRDHWNVGNCKTEGGRKKPNTVGHNFYAEQNVVGEALFSIKDKVKMPLGKTISCMVEIIKRTHHKFGESLIINYFVYADQSAHPAKLEMRETTFMMKGDNAFRAPKEQLFYVFLPLNPVVPKKFRK